MRNKLCQILGNESSFIGTFDLNLPTDENHLTETRAFNWERHCIPNGTFICGLLHDMYINKSRIPLWCIPYCLFPGYIVTWA